MFKKIKKKIEQKTIEYAQKNIDEMAKIINRPKEGEIVKIENIRIPNYFRRPKKTKIEAKKKYYERYKYFRSTIVLNKDNFLIDGYTTYLLALNFGYEYITILREE